MKNYIFRPFSLLLVTAAAVFAQTPAIEPGVSQTLARWRAARYSDVRYNLSLTLEKMSPVVNGTMEIRLKLSEPPASAGRANANTKLTPIILDWRKLKGSEALSTVSNVSVNGRVLALSSNFSWPLTAKEPAKAGTQNEFYEVSEHLIFWDGVVEGENVIRLHFTSPILTSGSAITRYVDKNDGAEYIYSLFVPSDASTAFPSVDQPDIKARFQLEIIAPHDWKVVSNGLFEGVHQTENYNEAAKDATSVTLEKTWVKIWSFGGTRPISTYVFAFAAGPWEQVSEPPASAGGTNAVASSTLPPLGQRSTSAQSTPPAYAGGSDRSVLATSIYVRRSQLAKFKPHAAEVFRLNREGVRFLETYFDYKFPFPKYDIVLIPEFPFGGMEHAGATFLREDRVIFPQEPTKNDHITRANVIFHEAAHQWFGDTVTMRWFDDLWLKEGFAEFMAYKTLEKVMPEYNAWKVFYERNKQAAYLTDSTKGTTPIYQEIANLSAAKSAYGNIVYRKAPSFLKQAEFYIGPDIFQTAVRGFLKKHEFGNAGWEDLVNEFETSSGQNLKEWANGWVKARGGPVVRSRIESFRNAPDRIRLEQYASPYAGWRFKTQVLWLDYSGDRRVSPIEFSEAGTVYVREEGVSPILFVFPNYHDYAYGIFLLDDKSRDHVLKNIQSEHDDFLRTMMWGSLWDSVREGELDPREYVELVVKVLGKGDAFTRSSSRGLKGAGPGKTPKGVTLTAETDESTIQTLLGRVSTAMNYYLSEPPAVAGGSDKTVAADNLGYRVETMLIDRMQNAPTPGLRITYYRAFLNIASSENARGILKVMLKGGNLSGSKGANARRNVTTKDKFDIVARLVVLGDPEARSLLAALEKTETSDEAKRYAYAARAGFGTAENKAKYWSDFTVNKDISESWIESAFGPFNSVRHSDLTLPYLERALAELPNLKRSRKIFFVNGWLGAFIGGQRSGKALDIVNKFLVDNPNLDRDLRLKILENVDLIERAVKIRGKYGVS